MLWFNFTLGLNFILLIYTERNLEMNVYVAHARRSWLSGGKNEYLAECVYIPKTKPPATKITKAPYKIQENFLAITVN